MQIIVLVQIILFLFISPFIISVFVGGVEYLYAISFIFLSSFVAGLVCFKLFDFGLVKVKAKFAPMFPEWIKFVIIGWTLCYIVVVVSNGLVFRRQGSEFMAEVYSNLPLFELLILRIYEILYFPLIIVMIASLVVDKGNVLRFSILVAFIGFLFSGVADSRTKLITPIVLYYMVFSGAFRRELISVPIRYLYIGAIIIVFSVIFIGLGRIDSFEDLNAFFLNDWVTRTDGLELISLVHQEIDIPIYGTHDIKLFSNFIAMIPFHPDANTLKMMGMTSGKSYLLQEILGLQNYDINNSLITDLYYFGGFFVVFVGGFIYGYFVAKFDSVVHHENIFSSRVAAAFFISFVINAFRIELDYFTTVAAIVRDAIIIYMVYLTIRLEKIAVESDDSNNNISKNL